MVDWVAAVMKPTSALGGGSFTSSEPKGREGPGTRAATPGVRPLKEIHALDISIFRSIIDLGSLPQLGDLIERFSIQTVDGELSDLEAIESIYFSLIGCFETANASNADRRFKKDCPESIQPVS